MEEIFCIAAFRSRLHVMHFERLLQARGVRAVIVTTPRAVSVGCGLSVRFDESALDRVRSLIRQEAPASLVGLYRVRREPSGRSTVSPLT